MKVLFLAPELLPNWGGAGTYFIELARIMSTLLDVHIATLERYDAQGKAMYTQSSMEAFFDHKVTIHILNRAPVNDTFVYNATFQWSVWRQLRTLMTQHRFDLVHGSLPAMPDLLVKLFSQDFPFVSTVHTMIEGHQEGAKASKISFSQLEFSEKCTALLFPLLQVAENMYLRKSPEIITVSNWMKRVLVDAFPFLDHSHYTIDVVNNGIDEVKYSPSNASKPYVLMPNLGKPIVLFSSRFTTIKGVHYLIHAIPEIINRVPNVHFVFTGSGATTPWINLLQMLQIPDTAYSFLGYVDYQLLPVIYAKADIFVAPTLYDNFPFRILEAMSSQTPVVASNICGIPEIITHGYDGLLIPPGNIARLTEAIITLLENVQYRNTMAQNARKTILEKFRWKTISRELLNTYESILMRM
jgi:glycosyltransferase involved in cell wall biosynthesis